MIPMRWRTVNTGALETRNEEKEDEQYEDAEE